MGEAAWWDANYLYRQVIKITAPGGEAVPVSYSAVTTLDTAALESATKVRADRKDWRIVYWDGSTNTELDRHYAATNATWFKIQAQINAGADTSAYYCYYGYAAESSSPAEEFNNVYWMGDSFEDGNLTSWVESKPANFDYTASTSSPIVGSYSMLGTSTDTPSGASEVHRSFTTTSSDVRLDLRLNAGANMWIMFCNGLERWFYLRKDGSNFNYYNYGSGWVTIATWPGGDVRVQIDLDRTNSQFDLYLDEVLEENNAALAYWKPFSRLLVQHSLTTSDIKMDNVIVRLLMATAPTVAPQGEAGPISNTLKLQWDLASTSTVTNTQQFTWDIHTAVVNTQQFTWDIRNIVSNTLALQWDMGGSGAGNVQQFTWDIRQLAQNTLALYWAVIGPALPKVPVSLPRSQIDVSLPRAGHVLTRVYSESADGYVVSSSSVSYAQARSGGTLSGRYLDIYAAISQEVLLGAWTVYRAFITFDLSNIPSTATINTATLNAYVYQKLILSALDVDIQVYRYAWTESIPANASANYAGAYGANATLEGTLVNTADTSTGEWCSLALDADNLNAGGDAKYSIVCSADVNGVSPGDTLSAQRMYLSGGDDAVARRMYLDIEYTPATDKPLALSLPRTQIDLSIPERR
jgi:hypothetical protein